MLPRVIAERPPVVVGLGRLALDVVSGLPGHGLTLPTAGGTMGNVLTILAALGWRSFPVAAIGPDDAGEALLEDLAAFSVDVRYVHVEGGGTPIWIEILDPADMSGTWRHEYRGFCPVCEARLPRFRTPPRALVELALEQERPDCVFVDRLTPMFLEEILRARTAGSIVIFEPSAALTPDVAQIIANVDMLKYSSRYTVSPEPRRLSSGAIEIRTHGAKGFEYRVGSGDWLWREAVQARRIVDDAGCGDWFTAGLLHKLVGSSPAALEDSLAAAREVAAWNCSFLGARGGMYVSTADEREWSSPLGLRDQGIARAVRCTREVRICSSCSAFSSPSST